jgi:DNA-binding transcriptional regulator YiaG
MRHMTTNCLPLHQESFGVALRCWRLQRGLSQDALGRLLAPQVKRSTVSCWESGLRFPARKVLGQIVALTGISADLALGGKP